MTTFDLPHAGNIARTVLSNGITVLVYEMPHVQSVTVHGYVMGGRLYESKQGVAHFTALSLMSGTQARDFDAIHNTLEDIGADFSFYSGTTTTPFGGKALAEDLPVLLDLLRECLLFPTFPQDRVDVMRTQALTTLKYLQQDSRHRATRAFDEALYPLGHPYRELGMGNLTSLPLITRDDLHQYHAQQFAPNGMVIIMVGAINAERATQWVAERLATWDAPTPTPRTIPTANAPHETKRIMTPIDGKTQSDVIIGTLGPTRKDPDYIAASVANSVLGEFGMMGRLGGIIREELGLAYYASSRLEGAEGQGSWVVSAGVAPHNIGLATEKAIEQVARMVQHPISDSDLADIQSYYTGRLPLRLENSAGIVASIEQMERFRLGLDYLAQYHDMIYSITQEDVLRAMRRFWNPQALIISVAGAE